MLHLVECTIVMHVQVLKCYDYESQRLVAVKVIRNKSRFHHQAKTELKILHHLVRKARLPMGSTCKVI